MALVLADRVRETSTTTGTVAVVLGGAYPSFQSFLVAVGNSNTTYYAISNLAAGEWEVGVGTYTSSGNTLSRDTVLSSSNSGSLVNFSIGSKDVICTQPSERAVYVNAANTQVSVPQLAATSITDSGNLTFTGTGNRITGDFSNATLASRVAFQTSTTDGSTTVTFIPNGTSEIASLVLASTSSVTNASTAQLVVTNAESSFRAGRNGTGTYLPMTFYTGGSERARIDTSGNVGIGNTPSGTYKLEVTGAIATSSNLTFAGTGNRITGDMSNATLANRVAFQTSTVNGNTTVGAIPNGTGTNALFLSYGSSDTANASRSFFGTVSGETTVRSDLVGTGTYLPMTFYTGGSERMRLDTSGNLGIGLTAPPQLLAVGNSTDQFGAGVSGVVTTAYFGSPSSGAGGIKRIAYDRANGELSVIGGTVASPSTQLTIDSSGNVGIGTVSPQGKFNVGGGRSNFGANSEIYSIGVGYTQARVSSGQTYYMGATDSATPDLVFSNAAGIERMRIDTSGNVGIGTSSNLGSSKLDVRGRIRTGSGDSSGDAELIFSNYASATTAWLAAVRQDVGGANNDLKFLRFNSSGTYQGVAMQIDSASGNVGIGTSSPTQKLDVTGQIRAANATTSNAFLLAQNSAGLTYLIQTSAYGAIYTPTTQPLVFDIAGGEKMRIDSSGNLLVGTTNTSLTAGVGVKFIASATEPYMAYVINSAGGSNFHLYNTNATNNGYRFYVTTNGGIANFSANNTNLSDERTKTDIQNAGSYLAKICAIPVRTFKYKDQADDLLNLGVIAQEVESIAPELVDISGFGDTPEDGIPLKSIYQTDLQYALMKCIQEQQALITSLTARITALESI